MKKLREVKVVVTVISKDGGSQVNSMMRLKEIHEEIQDRRGITLIPDIALKLLDIVLKIVK